VVARTVSGRVIDNRGKYRVQIGSIRLSPGGLVAVVVAAIGLLGSGTYTVVRTLPSIVVRPLPLPVPFAPIHSVNSVKGHWEQQNGGLDLVVTQVDVQGGHVSLHVKATNNSDAAMSLPLFGYFSAIDDADKTYAASPFDSDWTITIPSHGAITGVIKLEGTVSPTARTLTISFTVVFGESAPDGGITIRGVPLPV
jgi:hypothetical protein